MRKVTEWHFAPGAETGYYPVAHGVHGAAGSLCRSLSNASTARKIRQIPGNASLTNCTLPHRWDRLRPRLSEAGNGGALIRVHP